MSVEVARALAAGAGALVAVFAGASGWARAYGEAPPLPVYACLGAIGAAIPCLLLPG